MNTMSTKQVVARYSVLKVGAWVALVGSAAAWMYADGDSRGWRLPSGHFGGLYLGAVLGILFFMIVALALISNLAFLGGVVIAKVEHDLVLYFPFGRKRIDLRNGLRVSATRFKIEAPKYGLFPWFKTQPVMAGDQVTLTPRGQADINFRTALLSENAAVISERLSLVLKEDR